MVIIAPVHDHTRYQECEYTNQRHVIVQCQTRKNATVTNFCNPEIPGLGCRQSQDSVPLDCNPYLVHFSNT